MILEGITFYNQIYIPHYIMSRKHEVAHNRKDISPKTINIETTHRKE